MRCCVRANLDELSRKPLPRLTGMDISGTDNVDFVSSLGAHYVYDYTKAKLSEIDHQCDAVFDAAGRYERHYFSKQLKKEGIYFI